MPSSTTIGTSLGLALALACTPALAAGHKVAVLTAYLSSVATGELIEAFKGEPAAKDWSINVVDTAGDFGALSNRLEDVVSAKVDAIVLASVDPKQVQEEVSAAAKAGIPVFSMDGAVADGVVLNVTSDNFAMGKQLSDFLFGKLGGKGNIAKFYYSAHPGVHQRELALDAALKADPDVKVIADHYVKVPGPIDDSRQAMEDMLRANPGKINGVWAGWDEPAIGAVLALQSENATGNILVAGIDGNPQAIELIKQCTPLIGTVKQNFPEMAKLTAAAVADYFAGTKPQAAELKAPAILITRDSLGVKCN